jgi:hypothetical protein
MTKALKTASEKVVKSNPPERIKKQQKSKKLNESTSRLRNASKQTSFRKKSGASRKEEKHVAHTLDLELAKFISSLSRGKEDTESLREILNHKSNFQMSMAKTNLVDHRDCARELMEKYKSGIELTRKEERRARHQVKFIVLNKRLWPEGFKNGCVKFYKALKTKDNKTLIDIRKLQ